MLKVSHLVLFLGKVSEKTKLIFIILEMFLLCQAAEKHLIDILTDL